MKLTVQPVPEAMHNEFLINALTRHGMAKDKIDYCLPDIMRIFNESNKLNDNDMTKSIHHMAQGIFDLGIMTQRESVLTMTTLAHMHNNGYDENVKIPIQNKISGGYFDMSHEEMLETFSVMGIYRFYPTWYVCEKIIDVRMKYEDQIRPIDMTDDEFIQYMKDNHTGIGHREILRFASDGASPAAATLAGTIVETVAGRDLFLSMAMRDKEAIVSCLSRYVVEDEDRIISKRILELYRNTKYDIRKESNSQIKEDYGMIFIMLDIIKTQGLQILMK